VRFRVKSALLVLPVYAAIFAALFSLLTLLSVIYFWIEASQAVMSLGWSVLTPQIAATLPSMVSLCSIFSLFFLLFSYRRKRQIGLAVFASAFLLTSLVYGGLFLLIQRISPNEQRPGIIAAYEAERFYSIGEKHVYSERVSFRDEAGIRTPHFSPILLIDPHSLDAKPETQSRRILSLYREGIIDRNDEKLRFDGAVSADTDATKSIELREGNESILASIEPPSLIRAFAGEARLCAGNLERLLSRSIFHFAAAIAIQVLFVIVAWSFIRTSSWPLFNSIIALLMLRGFFFLYRISSAETVESLLSGFSLEAYYELFPSAALLVLTLLFGLWNLAFYAGRKEKS